MDALDKYCPMEVALRWRHNGHDCVSNHQPRHCLLNRLFERRSKKTSKLRVTGLCAGSSPGTGEFPAQMASNAENVSIWWRHHGISVNAWTHFSTFWHFWCWSCIAVQNRSPKCVSSFDCYIKMQSFKQFRLVQQNSTSSIFDAGINCEKLGYFFPVEKHQL